MMISAWEQMLDYWHERIAIHKQLKKEEKKREDDD